MRDLAIEERISQFSSLQTLLRTTLPLLLVQPSSSISTESYNTLIEIKSGVGGSEASLFLNELARMYVRYAQANGWKASVSLGSETEIGIARDASINIIGRGSYDDFRWESGVHRVQRVPATEGSGRIHTSTVAVIVSHFLRANSGSRFLCVRFYR
jgi:peptide chain release factor 1